MRIIFLVEKNEEKNKKKRQKTEGGVSTSQNWCLKIPLDQKCLFFTYFVEIPPNSKKMHSKSEK